MIKRPNIVYVMPDEFRQQALGFRNEDPTITPYLDRFSREALCLENAVSNYPVCSPYRGMLMTGQYPWSNGVIGNCNTSTKAYGVYLKEKQVCFTDVLSVNGYDCGYIGKWHLDAPEESEVEYLEGYRKDGKLWDAYNKPGPRRHGINFWYAYGCNDKHFKPHYWKNEDKVEEVRYINKWSVEHETDIAIEYIFNKNNERNDSKPFALFIAYNPPHMPFEEVPQRYLDKYEDKGELLTRPNVGEAYLPKELVQIEKKYIEESAKLSETAIKNVKNYFAAVTGIDENFGRILQALKDTGLEDDTIIVFTSDHGEMMGSHSLMYKGLWYNEGYKVPFLIKYKNVIQTGEKNFFLNVPDIMPTLLDLIGLGDQLPKGIEGVSCKQALLEEIEGPKESFYINTQIDVRGVKNHINTLVVRKNAHGEESYILYDDKKDPYQLKNIAKENMELVKQLRIKLETWLYKTQDIWIK